ncbi:MAG: sugar phosphate isomerase/epimerase [Candidatus Ratteibacteria bacterium]|nr:sugar phosphate isomerase/epimerase [Candidatus Ratteibacteria bacterium]
MKNVLQINYWTVGGFEGKTPVADAIKAVKDMGLDGIELTFEAGEFSPGISKDKCKEIKRFADSLGMKIETCASGNYWGLSLAATSSTTRKKAIAFTKEYLQVASWVGAKVCLVIPGAVFVPWEEKIPVTPYAKVWELATSSIKELIPFAKKAGVKIGIENVWNGFLADPIAMRTFIDQFKSPYVGAYFDVANCVINGFPEHWIEILGRRIVAVHIKNFKRTDCAGGLHGFGDDLLEGDVNFKAVIKALKKIGYRGPLTAEMIPFSRLPNLVLPDMQLARDTAKKMQQLFKGK